ncbi:MAG: PilN domain-containing protein [Elusimicrobia bacterium]|nr:PilN domain-containing protein [Candidatus Obscuribacterium magneticum]
MICINLLPPEYAEAQSQREQKILFSTVGGCLLACMVLFLGIKKRQAAVLKADIARAQAELDRYQTIVAQMNQIQNDKQKLLEKRDVIKNLNRSRLIYPVLLDDLLPIIPPDVWITNIQFEEQGAQIKISMDNNALSNYALATWLTNLKQCIHFSGVNLVGAISYTKTDQGQTLTFKTAGFYQHQGPFPLLE